MNIINCTLQLLKVCEYCFTQYANLLKQPHTPAKMKYNVCPAGVSQWWSVNP